MRYFKPLFLLLFAIAAPAALFYQSLIIKQKNDKNHEIELQMAKSDDSVRIRLAVADSINIFLKDLQNTRNAEFKDILKILASSSILRGSTPQPANYNSQFNNIDKRLNDIDQKISGTQNGNIEKIESSLALLRKEIEQNRQRDSIGDIVNQSQLRVLDKSFTDLIDDIRKKLRSSRRERNRAAILEEEINRLDQLRYELITYLTLNRQFNH